MPGEANRTPDRGAPDFKDLVLCRKTGTVTEMSHGFVRIAFIVCIAATLGCSPRVGSHKVRVLPADNSGDCKLISEPGEPVGTVALGERVDPGNAPRPSNESERLV